MDSTFSSLGSSTCLGICRVCDSLAAFKPGRRGLDYCRDKWILEELTSKNRELLRSKRDARAGDPRLSRLLWESAQTRWVGSRGQCGGLVKRGEASRFSQSRAIFFSNVFLTLFRVDLCGRGVPELFRAGWPSEWGISYFTNRVTCLRVCMLVPEA